MKVKHNTKGNPNNGTSVQSVLNELNAGNSNGNKAALPKETSSLPKEPPVLPTVVSLPIGFSFACQGGNVGIAPVYRAVRKDGKATGESKLSGYTLNLVDSLDVAGQAVAMNGESLNSFCKRVGWLVWSAKDKAFKLTEEGKEKRRQLVSALSTGDNARVKSLRFRAMIDAAIDNGWNPQNSVKLGKRGKLSCALDAPTMEGRLAAQAELAARNARLILEQKHTIDTQAEVIKQLTPGK